MIVVLIHSTYGICPNKILLFGLLITSDKLEKDRFWFISLFIFAIGQKSCKTFIFVAHYQFNRTVNYLTGVKFLLKQSICNNEHWIINGNLKTCKPLPGRWLLFCLRKREEKKAFLQIFRIPNCTPHLLLHGLFNMAAASVWIFLLSEQ